MKNGNNKEIDEIIQKFKNDISNIYGNRLKNLYLYGSYARGEGNDNSDIDLMVLLGGKVNPGKEIDRMIDILTDINLNYGVLLSVYPISENEFLNLKSPVLANIHREGLII